jgi:hypothetical protein
VPSDEAVMLVLVPSGGTETREGRRLLVDGVVIDYNATLLPDNLVRNPDVDSANANDPNRPSFWHYSTNASWSADEAFSPTHSLELVDNSATAFEEWRSYATDVPAGEDRAYQLRWFWKYDIEAGEEFRARLRLSEDEVISLDLTNPLVELNFTVAGQAGEFEMFETTIQLPDGIQSFDLTFLSGGALSALGSIYIDDISFALLDAAGLAGDYNGNGVVDAADYTAWRDALTAGATVLLNDPTPGTVDETDFDYWRAHFGETAGSGAVADSAAAVPEPSTVMLFLVGTLVVATIARRGVLG